MAGFYKKAVVWLGLNEDYPDEIETPGSAGERAQAARVAARREPRPEPRAEPRPEPRAEPRPVRESRDEPKARSQVPVRDPLRHSPNAIDRAEGSVRAVPMEDNSRIEAAPIGTVRAVAIPKTVKPKVIVPRSFNDAQMVADTFREPKPVIVNMQSAERDLARRLIDFSSGLCYGLGGQMEKVAKDVYLLTPDEVEVAEEDRDAF